MSGGIQADTDKTNPQWIHSGEPGTSGREPFEEDGVSGVPAQHNHEQQHGHHHGHQGQAGGVGAGVGSGLTGAGYDDTNRSGLGGNGGLTGGGAGYDQSTLAGLRGDGTGHHHHGHHGASDETLGRSGVTGERGQGIDTSNAGSGITGGVGGAGVGSGGRGLENSDTVRGLGSGGAAGGYKEFDNNPSFGDNANRSSGFDGDRVGDRNEGGALYERTGNQGPATTGAAGTDRFDSDRHRGSGTAGRDVGTGAHRGVGDLQEDSAYERTGGGELGASSGRGGAAGTNNGPTTGTGGFLSGLTTTDNEFTGKDRSHTGPNIATSGGAYEDTSGDFKSNTSGPGGNTALTGREGTTEKNPVAQASSTGAGAGEPTGRVGQVEGETEKKGIVQKIKDML